MLKSPMINFAVNRKAKKKVMIVDDNITNLTVAKKALEADYAVIPVPSGKKALELLEKSQPSLILLDIEMPEMNGFDTIKQITANELTKDIPVLFLTARDDFGSELEGLKLGAVDYITKPFSVPLLLQRVGLHIELVRQREELQEYNKNLSKMVKDQTEVIAELQHAIIHTLSDLVESRDGCTAGHVTRTQSYLEALTLTLKNFGEYSDELNSLDLELFFESAQLHDIGKISVPDSILQKPGKLTDEEYEIMKRHTYDGERAIKNAMRMTRADQFLKYAATIAISHHERWDGTGYPYGLKGEEIPLQGRLMAIADVYDALVSERPYKRAYTHEEAMEIIIAESGSHFDPKLVDAFVKSEGKFENILKAHEAAIEAELDARRKLVE